MDFMNEDGYSIAANFVLRFIGCFEGALRIAKFLSCERRATPPKLLKGCLQFSSHTIAVTILKFLGRCALQAQNGKIGERDTTVDFRKRMWWRSKVVIEIVLGHIDFNQSYNVHCQ